MTVQMFQMFRANDIIRILLFKRLSADYQPGVTKRILHDRANVSC